MWPAERSVLHLRYTYLGYRGMSLYEEIALLLKQVDFSEVSRKFMQLMPSAIGKRFVGDQKKQEFETFCERWRGLEGQFGGDTMRGRLLEARAANESTDDFELFKKLAFKVELPSQFLFRGVSPAKEYAALEPMTATSTSLKRAYNYGILPFIVIYVPEKVVRGLPIVCEGSGQDQEVLLVEPGEHMELLIDMRSENKDEWKANPIAQVVNEYIVNKMDEVDFTTIPSARFQVYQYTLAE